MAYTTIDDPTAYFNTKLYTGTGSSNSITGIGHRPDFVWTKRRNSSGVHFLSNSVQGANKALFSNDNSAEFTGGVDGGTSVTSFDSDGFTVGTEGAINASSDTFVSWNWLAGGTAPAITYTVKVVSDSGNKYRFDDFGTSAVTLDLQEGGTYTFDLSHCSNDGHPMKFSTTSNGSHGGGSTYSTGIVYQLDGASVTEANYYNTSNFNSASSRKIIITVAASAPTLYYFCHYHSGMGGQANTNSLFGSSNFSGAIQSKVSVNTTSGFSIVTYTGAGGDTSIGHGLGAKPDLVISKNLNAGDWNVFHESFAEDERVKLNNNLAKNTNTSIFALLPTSSVVNVGHGGDINTSGHTHLFYCFTRKKSFSHFGVYTGNGNDSGEFIYTGFKPSLLIVRSTGLNSWEILDNKRNSFNPTSIAAFADSNGAEYDYSEKVDFLSNGFKLRGTAGGTNSNGVVYFYIAFAESPFVNSNSVPTNAR